MPKKSYGQDLIEQSQEQVRQQSGLMNYQAFERKKMVENSRKSNFHIGEQSQKNNKFNLITNNQMFIRK